MDVTVRKACCEEVAWINSRYDEVGFKHSDFNRELIAIAQIHANRIGIGRLVTLSDTEAELGGMYVFADYRGSGIAGKIVEFLLQQSGGFKKIFCLPFAHLQDFYGKYGFLPTDGYQDVPPEVCEKHTWCNCTYEHKTLLLVLAR